jgi:hypothetical protein
VGIPSTAASGATNWTALAVVRAQPHTDAQAHLISSHLIPLALYGRYVPHHNARGEDSFTFTASDCSGNRLRSAPRTARVSVAIQNVNDPPLAGIFSRGFKGEAMSTMLPLIPTSGDTQPILLPVHDGDGPQDLTSVVMTSLSIECGESFAPMFNVSGGVAPGTPITATSLPVLLPPTEPVFFMRALSVAGCEPYNTFMDRLAAVGTREANSTAMAVQWTVSYSFPQGSTINEQLGIAFVHFTATDRAGANGSSVYPIIVFPSIATASSSQDTSFDDAFIYLLVIAGALLLTILILVRWIRRRVASHDMHLVSRRTGAPPKLDLPPSKRYHIFLSHTWKTGQDQMAVVKRQLCSMLPGVSVFLEYSRSGSNQGLLRGTDPSPVIEPSRGQCGRPGGRGAA